MEQDFIYHRFPFQDPDLMEDPLSLKLMENPFFSHVSIHSLSKIILCPTLVSDKGINPERHSGGTLILAQKIHIKNKQFNKKKT